MQWPASDNHERLFTCDQAERAMTQRDSYPARICAFDDLASKILAGEERFSPSE